MTRLDIRPFPRSGPEVTPAHLANLHRALSGVSINNEPHPFAEMLDLMHDLILRTDDAEDRYSLAEDIVDLAARFRDQCDEDLHNDDREAARADDQRDGMVSEWLV